MKTKFKIKGMDGFGLQEYKHYDIMKSEEDMNKTKDDIYKVVTINHTPASNHKSGKDKIHDWSKVHKNMYYVSCEDLVEWCADFMEVSETILSIKKMNSVKKIK
jgi:hypothetical protein